MQALLNNLRRWMGIDGVTTGHLEKWVSATGGLVALMIVLQVSQVQLGLQGAAVLVASMGASAVLLFAVPHGPLSQPWSVFGGHLVSAVVGVACARAIADPALAAAMAVGLAIGAMHYLRCIHPPGGATALSAVVGGNAVHQLGYQFVLTPVLVNVMTILLVALVFNAPFSWRRYPLAWASVGKTAAAKRPGNENLLEKANERIR
jgi:CBS-domain-containing membrane protein